MIQNIQDSDEDSFLRHWSERVWDKLQLAHIAAIEQELVTYAMTGWRPMSIAPPMDVLLLGSCEEGVVVMSLNQINGWRTSQGIPHKPPRAWMYSPPPEPR